MKILTAQQMRELDRLTVERCGIPYATLMETAGSRVVEEISQRYGSKYKCFAVYCGKGNNGGDGAVIARQLWMRRASRVDVYLFGKLEEIKGEARENFETIRKIVEQENLYEDPADVTMSFHIFDEEFQYSEIENGGADVIIDALLGTGTTRPVEGAYAEAIESINDMSGITKIVSVDIPSGLAADNPNLIGPHVKADLTVTFTAPKFANVCGPAADANGELIIVPIGTPYYFLNQVVESNTHITERYQVEFPLRSSFRTPQAHKNSVGDVLLIAGSRGKTGAAALASETILKAGAGLVTVATAKSAQASLVAQTCAEVMTESLAETENGAISHEAIGQTLQLAQKKTVIAIGPGLSSGEDSTRSFVRELVERRTAPMVIDADGLNALAPWPDELKGSDELPIIITPHPGEMARLIGKTNADVQADRIGIAREFATKHHVIVVLKGSRSLIAEPDGNVYVNPTGNAGMATAGSGDVLTGLIAGLLAQSPANALGATIAGVYLHGLAGDIAAGKLGMRSMIASDIIANLSEAILQIGGEAEKGQPSAITSL